jgi:hypothetical protein
MAMIWIMQLPLKGKSLLKKNDFLENLRREGY